MKKFVFLFFVFSLLFFVRPVFAENDSALAMLKINTYALNSAYKLEYQGSGSGAIIDPKGIIMTNYHVIRASDNLEDNAYIICLNKDLNEKPDCSYTASLIAGDEDLDIALLQINNIAGHSSDSSFAFLDYYQSDTTSNGQNISVLGYPGIGGDTLSITQGTISGKETKYNRNWLKTDAVVSYGSSGGVAIDQEGKIIGLTSMAYSDTIASLGYIININSLNDFIDENINKEAQVSLLKSRVENIAKVMISAEADNQVYSADHYFQLTKPGDWDLSISEEGSLILSNSDDENSGMFALGYDVLATEVDDQLVINYLRKEFEILGAVMNVVRNEDIEIAGLEGKKIRLSFLGEFIDLYVLPYQNHFFTIMHDYGKDDKDEDKVNEILSTLSFNLDDISFLAKREFLKEDPFISFFVNDNWGLMEINSEKNFLTMHSRSEKNTIVDFSLLEIDSDKDDYSPSEYLSHLKELKQMGNMMASMFSVSVSLNEQSANYYLSPQISDALLLEYVYKNDEDEAVYYTREYFKKLNDDYYLQILATSYAQPDKDYASTTASIEEVLQNLNLGLSDVIKEEEEEGEIIEEEVVLNQKREIRNQAMHSNLKGKIILQVEANGEAYYIHPDKLEMFSLGRPDDAFSVMREQGVGISNENLLKIPVADTSALKRVFEEVDSDGDGYNDYTELSNGYNPYGEGKINYDLNFTSKNSGKIFLQVENNGEAWYVNGEDNKRYFLGRPDDAFSVMRNLGLGISNENLNKLQ